MRTCTSTDLHAAYGENPCYFSMEESIHACTEAGFECMDLNLHSVSLSSDLLSDDTHWQDWVWHMKELIDDTDTEVPYAHSFFYLHPNRTERLDTLTCRSIEAAGMLGVKWVTVHPYSVRDDAWYSHRRSLEDNHRFMERYATIANRYHCGIAIENMVEASDGRRFGSSAEDLLELYELLNDPIFGVCWDFGHGERSSCNTIASLQMIGSKLKNVHVHDYTLNKVGYDHTLPFHGLIDWSAIMPVMIEIGYLGEWNLECHNFTKQLPPELRKTALKCAFETCEYMVKMI